VPVLLPLSILAGVYGLELLKLRTRGRTVGLRVALVVGALACILPNTIIQSRATESAGLYGELEKIAGVVGSNAAIFVDSVDFPRVELATSLQVSFGTPTFTYSRRDYTGTRLQAFMKTISMMGYDVFLLSAKDRRGSLKFLEKKGAYSLSLSLLSAKRGEMMPTVHNQRNQRVFLHRFITDYVE